MRSIRILKNYERLNSETKAKIPHIKILTLTIKHNTESLVTVSSKNNMRNLRT